MRKRDKLFCVLYVLIVMVLFCIVVFIDKNIDIPFIGSFLAISLGISMSTGKIRDLVEFIIDEWDDHYYLD